MSESQTNQLNIICSNVDTLKIPISNEPYTTGIASALKKEAKKNAKVDFATEVHYDDNDYDSYLKSDENRKIHDEIKL
jgi:hypothetical protein